MSDNRRAGRGRGRGYGHGHGQYSKPSHRGSWRRRNFNNNQDRKRDGGQNWENPDQTDYWDDDPVREDMSPRWEEHLSESGARDQEYNAVYYEDELSQEEEGVLRGELGVDEARFRERERHSQDREVRDRDLSPYYRSHWSNERDIRERSHVDHYVEGDEEYSDEWQRWDRARWNRENDREEFRDENEEAERMDEGWNKRSYHDDRNSYDGNNRHEKHRKYNRHDSLDEINMDVHRDKNRDHDGHESYHDDYDNQRFRDAYDNQGFRDDYNEQREYDKVDNRDENDRRDYNCGDRETDDFEDDRRHKDRFDDSVDDLQYDNVSPELQYDNVSPEHDSFPDDDRSSGHHRSQNWRDRKFDRKASRHRGNKNYVKGRELSQERTPSPIRDGDLLPVMNQDIPPDIALQEGQIVIGPDGQLPPGVPIMIDPGLGPHIIPQGTLVGDNMGQVLVPFTDAPIENVSLDIQAGQEVDEPRGFHGRGRGRGYNQRHNRGRGRGRGFKKFQRRDNQRHNEPPAQSDVERMEQVPLPGAGPVVIEPGMVQVGIPEMMAAPGVGPGIPLVSMAGPMPVIVDPTGNMVQQVFVPLQGVDPNLPPGIIKNLDQRDQDMHPDRDQRGRSWDKDLERQEEDQRHWDDRQRNRRDDRDSRPKEDRHFNRSQDGDKPRDNRQRDDRYIERRRDDNKYKGGKQRDDRGQNTDRHKDNRLRDEKHDRRREDDQTRSGRDSDKHSRQSRRYEELRSGKERWGDDRHSPKRGSRRSADSSQDKHKGSHSSKDSKSEDFSKKIQDVISKQKKSAARDDQAMISLLQSALVVMQDKVRKSDSEKKFNVSSKSASGASGRSRDNSSSENRSGSKRHHTSADRSDAKKPRVEQVKGSSKHPSRKEGGEHDNTHNSRQSTSSRASSISTQESKHKDSKEHTDKQEEQKNLIVDSSTIKNLSEKLESVLEKQRKQGEKIDNSMVMLLKSALDVAKKRTGEKPDKEEKPSTSKQPPKPVKFNIKTQEKEAEIQKSMVQESWQTDDIDSEEENYSGDEEDKTMEESLKVRSSELLQGKKSEHKPPPVKLDITQIDEPKEEWETTIIKRSKLPGKDHLRKRGQEDSTDDIDNEQAVVMNMKEKKKLTKEKKNEQDKPQTTEQSQGLVNSNSQTQSGSISQAQVGENSQAQVGQNSQAQVGQNSQAQVGQNSQAQVGYVQQPVNAVQQPVQQPIQSLPVQQQQHQIQPLQQPWGAGAIRLPVSLPHHPASAPSQAMHQIQTVTQVPRPTISYSQPPPLVTQPVMTAPPSSYPPPSLPMPQNVIQNQQPYVAVQHPQVVQQRPPLVAPHPLVPRPPPVVSPAVISQPSPQMMPPLGTVTTQMMHSVQQMPSMAVAGGQHRPTIVQQQPLVLQQPQIVARPPVIMQPVAPQPTPHISQPAVSYPTAVQPVSASQQIKTATTPLSLPAGPLQEGVSEDLLAIQQKALETLRKEKLEEEQKRRQQQQQQAIKASVSAPVNPVTNIRPNQHQALRAVAPASVAPYISQPRPPLQAIQPVSSCQKGTPQYRGPAPSHSTNKSSFPDSSVSRAPVKYDRKQQTVDTKNSAQEKKLYTAAELLERITAAKAAAQAKEKAQSTMSNILKGHRAKINLNVINTGSSNKNANQKNSNLKTTTAGQQGIAKTSVTTASTSNRGITPFDKNKKSTPKPLWKPEPSQAKEEQKGGDETMKTEETASMNEFKKTAENIIKQIPTLDQTRKPAAAKTGRHQSNLSRIPTNPSAVNLKQNTSTRVLSNLNNNPPAFSRPTGLQNMPRPGDPRFNFSGNLRPEIPRFGMPNNQNIAGPRIAPPGAATLPPPTLAFPNILSSVSRPIFPAGVPPVSFPNQPQQVSANTQAPPPSNVSLVPYTSSPPRDSSKKSQNVTQTIKADTGKGQDVSSRRKSPGRRRDSSPSRKSRSPTNHRRDTRRRSGSPDQRRISPANRSRSPNQRSEGTARRSRSPYRRITDSSRRRSGSLERRSPGYEHYRYRSPSRRSPDLFHRRGSPMEHYQFNARPLYDSLRPYPYADLSPLRDDYRQGPGFAYDSYRRYPSPPPRMHYHDDRLDFSPTSKNRYSSPPRMAPDYYDRISSPNYRSRDRSPGPYRGRSLSPRRSFSPPRMSSDFHKRRELSPRQEYSPVRRHGSPPSPSYRTREGSPGSSTYRRRRSVSPRDRRPKSPSKHSELSSNSSLRHRDLSPPSHKQRSPSPRSQSYRQEYSYEYKTHDPTHPLDTFKPITEPSNQKSKVKLSDQYRRSLSPIYRKPSQKQNESLNVASKQTKQDSGFNLNKNDPATSSDSGNTESSSEKLPEVLSDLFKNVEATRNIGYKPMSKSMADLLNSIPAASKEQKTTYPAGILKRSSAGTQQKVETDVPRLPQTGALSSIQEAYKEPTGIMPNLFEKLSAWLPGFGQGPQDHRSQGLSENQGPVQNNQIQRSLHSPSVSQPHTFDHQRYVGDTRNATSVSAPRKTSTGMEDSYDSFLDVIGFQRKANSQDAGTGSSDGPSIPGLDFFGDGNKNQSYGSEKSQQNYIDMYTTKQMPGPPGNMPVSSSSSQLFFDRPAVSYNRFYLKRYPVIFRTAAVFPSATRLQQILRK